MRFQPLSSEARFISTGTSAQEGKLWQGFINGLIAVNDEPANVPVAYGKVKLAVRRLTLDTNFRYVNAIEAKTEFRFGWQ